MVDSVGINVTYSGLGFACRSPDLGTRIVYERNFLMQLKNSPMAKTPPKNIQFIPGVTGFSPIKQSGLCVDNNNLSLKVAERKPPSPAANGVVGSDEQFEMDL